MSNKKLKPTKQPTEKQLQPGERKQKLDNEGKSAAQQLFDFTIAACREIITSELTPIKREIQDLKIINKTLLKRIMNLELDYRSLGASIANLGIVEINLLNETSNRIKQKLSVTDAKGGIQGRVDTNRFNLTPSSDKLMVEITNNVEKEEGVQVQ
jgi:hypothetical protein